MKKLFTLFCTIAVALSLAMPVFAKGKEKKGESTTKGESTEEHGKAHKKHKKGGGKGEAKGQETTNPSPKQ